MPDEKLCGAAPRAGGERTEPCKLRVSKGTNRCWRHGGKTPGAKAKAAEHAVEAKALKLLEALDAPPVADPLTALSHLAGEAIAWKNVLLRIVGDLEEKYRYRTDGGEQLRAEVALFERALDRCASILGMIAKLNIDERLARIEEVQAERIVMAFLSACDELGLGIEQVDTREQLAGVFTRNLQVH